MKKYFSFITVVLVLAFTGFFSSTYGQWMKHKIDTKLNAAAGPRIGDIDGDDTLDVIVTKPVANDIVWYKNKNAGLSWEEYTIDNNLPGAWLVNIGDIDGDTDLDVIATGQAVNDVVWYENDQLTWDKHTIDANLDGARNVAVADIDGDDTLDVIATGMSANKVVWYENNHPTWISHTIDEDFEAANYIYAADIDDDGDPDLLVTAWRTDRVVLYENNYPNWIKHNIDTELDGAVIVYVADIDGDTDMDIAATGERANDVVWYENDQFTWDKHTIDANLGTALGVSVADIDGDTDLDIVASGTSARKVVWYENKNAGLSWEKYTIDENLPYADFLDVADVDSDDRLDVVACAQGSGNIGDVVWYENLIGVAHAQSVQCYPGYIPPVGDTLIINVQVYNPESHPATIHAIISDEQNSFTESIQLYDDGQHHDNFASDNIWGNSKWLAGLAENTYTIGISTHDIAKDDINYLSPIPGFTTIGPVVEKGATITSSDTIPNPGDYLKFHTNLQNKGLTTTALDVSARLTLLDTCASFSRTYPIYVAQHYYGDIDPGEIVQSRGSSYIKFKDKCTDDHDIKFAMEISSNGYHFWSDTFEIDVISGLENEDQSIIKEFKLYQNYPNPFNPSTVISWQLAVGSQVELSIYNILGEKVTTLVSERQKAGIHQVEWDARDMASGVYYYRLVAQEYVDTKKLVVLK